MTGEGLAGYIPAELAGEYEPVSLLKERGGCRTILLSGRDGRLAVLKHSEEGAEVMDEGIYRSLCALKGEGVPKMLGLYTDGGARCLLREYVEGRTLLEICRERGPLSSRETADVGIQLSGTLERLHGLDTPLIHRDIKAENVVMTPDGRCVLIDFGIARLFDERDVRDTVIQGTGFSAAPEQFGYAQSDTRSDIYSLGVLLHELSTGEYMLEKGRVPAPLRRVLFKCTRFDPADRYQSAGEVRRALCRVRMATRRRTWAAVCAVTAALALVLLACAGRAPKGEIYTFASPEIGEEVARQLGKRVEDVTGEDLARITAIRLVGARHIRDWTQILIHGTALDIADDNEDDPEGSLAGGTVDTLADIPAFPNLTELLLCNQQIRDLTPLSGSGVSVLYLHGNEISDLSPLADCPSLSVLAVSGNPISDFSAVSALPALRSLNAGATLLDDLDVFLRFPALNTLDLVDCERLRSLEGVEKLVNLKQLSVRPVDREDLKHIDRLSGLEGLFAWSTSNLPDLTCLSDLTNLNYLFLDFCHLKSAEGLERLTKLRYLDLRCLNLLDAAPLAALTDMADLRLTSFGSEDWSELGALEGLESVTVTAEMEASVRASLEGRDMEVQIVTV